MINQTKLGHVLLKTLLCLVFVLPFFSSCTGLDELRDKIDVIEERLDSLESSLNGQIQAFDEFLSGQATISECEKNKDGSYAITLSNGTKFTVYPKTSQYNTLLTYVEEGDVKYWAVYDGVGNAVALTDADGNKIPVEAELPVVEERDGEYVIIIGGEEYTTGFSTEDIVSIFSDYELHKDDSGNVYSVTFTFGDGLTFTIPVDGYKGLSFHMVGDVNNKVIKDYYIGLGTTARVRIDVEDVIDYVMQVPDGWRVKEVVDSYASETYLEITAPQESAVSAGAAVANGDLKIVAVVEGGKSMVAKLELSTEPFKKFVATSSDAIIEKYNGVDKVLYGLCTFADFDKDAIMAGAEAMLQANDKGVSDQDVNVSLAELLGAELTTGERYVLWAIPAFYKSEGEEAGYYVKEGLIFTNEFGAISATVNVDKEDILFNDVTVSVKLAGFASYYGGTDVMSETLLSDIVYQINNDMIDPYTEPLTYEGSAFKFPTAAANTDLEVLSEETYATWIVPVVEGKTTYTVDDVVYQKYTLPGVTSGGTIEVKPGTATVGRVSVSVPLVSEGATRIYYAWLKYRTSTRYSTDADRASYLMSSGTLVNESTATALQEGLDPETKMVLFAMATDSKGKYGPVSVTEYTTEELVYNDLKVALEVEELGETKATIAVAVTKGTPTELVYWAGSEDDEFWVSLAGANVTEKRSSAQMKIALYPDDHEIVRAMTNFPIVDGKIVMTDLKGEKNHHVIVLAKDDSENYSMAGCAAFTTLAVDLGTIVTSGTTAWTTAKESLSIEFIPESFTTTAEYKRYRFKYTGPKDFTAYIAAGHKDYFEGRGYTMTIPEKIIDIRDLTSRPIDVSAGYTDEQEIYYNDQGEETVWGQANFILYGTHGLTTWGTLTYFSPYHHDESNCDACAERINDPKATSDRSYEGQLAIIQAKTTLEYWIDYVRKYRPVTNETYILKSAEAMLELYYDHYKDLKPIIYINDGSSLEIEQSSGWGPNDEGVVQDAVIVVLRDKDNNYYEPMFFPVENHWN